MTSSLAHQGGYRDQFHFAGIGLCRRTLSEIMDLQAIVDRHLTGIQNAFFLVKTETAMRRNMERPNYVAGARAGGQLVGTAFLLVCDAERPLHGLIDCPTSRALVADSDRTAVIGTVMTHPHARGRGLMNHMLDDLIEVAVELGYRQVLAEVAVANTPSCKGFHHAGFTEDGYDIDPADGTRLVFMRRRLCQGTAPCP